MVNYYEDEEDKSEPVPKKIYMIINDEKHYIDPEIVKKRDLRCTPFCRAWRPTGAAEKCRNQL